MKIRKLTIASFMIGLMLMASVLCFGSQAIADSGSGITVNINGSPLKMDVPPVIVNGRTLVPLRSIFEALGAQVQWDAATQTITATEGTLTITLTVGSTNATVGGTNVTMDVGPQIINGRTMVPLRFVSDSLGAHVNWDATNRTVNIVWTISVGGP